MLGILADIWCVLSHLDCYVLYALKAGVNAIIVALAAIVSLLFSTIPLDMPDPPELPAAMETAIAWVAWIVPVATVVAILAFFLSAWLMWAGISVVLRWAKAIE